MVNGQPISHLLCYIISHLDVPCKESRLPGKVVVLWLEGSHENQVSIKEKKWKVFLHIFNQFYSFCGGY